MLIQKTSYDAFRLRRRVYGELRRVEENARVHRAGIVVVEWKGQSIFMAVHHSRVGKGDGKEAGWVVHSLLILSVSGMTSLYSLENEEW